ncbi:MAG: DUF2971 domain-containing protein [Desulfobacterales bacterium]|jgi:hypothetical protein|nr:DUF2971 domain-containing protein [Desulfobacterales bacterium]
MLDKQPKKIYRYQTIDAITIKSLCHDDLYFANPADFNDPLDCKPTVISDSDQATLSMILSELIKRRVAAETRTALRNARLQGEKAEAHAIRSGEQTARRELVNIAYMATDPEFDVGKEEAECRLLKLEIQREILKQYDRGLCCFSATFKNPLLWSHYADQHRGICIGYGLNRVPKPKLHKVVYGGSRSVKTSLIARALLDNDQEAQLLLDQDVLLRKAPSWRYEREWRLLGERGVQQSSLELVEITFGLRCPNALKHSLVSALESRNRTVKFFEMYKLPGSFKLKRKLVDTDELLTYFPNIAQSAEEDFGPVQLE